LSKKIQKKNKQTEEKTKDSSAQLALNGKQSTAMAKTKTKTKSTMELRSSVFGLRSLSLSG